jgi:hypothetical protein
VEGLTRGQFADDGSSSSDVVVTGDSGHPKTDGGGTDGGTGGDSSTGTDSGATTTAFTGAGAFASNKPATSAVTYHTNNNVGVTPGKGVDCLGCHKMGGAGPAFLFAGTLFQDMNGNTPAVDKEIRVRGNDAKAYSAHSDDDGNFWYLPGVNETVAFPANCGARDGTNTSLMNGTISAASCNTCHDGATQAFIHLP